MTVARVPSPDIPKHSHFNNSNFEKEQPSRLCALSIKGLTEYGLGILFARVANYYVMGVLDDS